jgi:N,N'-diacetylchitobiose transport system permease protein
LTSTRAGGSTRAGTGQAGTTTRTGTAGPAIRRRRRGTGGRGGRLALNLAGLLAFLFFAFPVYWMASTALKPAGQIRTFDIRLFPATLTLEHFRTAFQTPNFWTYLRNSLVVALCTTVLSVLVALVAATGVARFRFRGRRAYLLTILIVQMVPLEALVIPMYLVLRDADLLDLLPVLVATYMAFVLPFTVWTLRGFVAALPVELEEAAMVDGTSRWGAFWRITFPLMAPGLVATGVYAFMQAWNEFILALTLMERENQTLPVWLGTFKTAQGVDWGGLMAASTIFAIPVVVFFLVVQGRIAGGLSAGAVKG